VDFSSGITQPSGEMHKQLMTEVFQESGVDPSKVSYFELHGTGTRAGDPQETNAVAEVLSGTTRNGPLLIGSTKSNMGHAEPVAGLVSLAKVLIMMHTGTIPPNLHYQTPNPNIPGLTDGRLKVRHLDLNINDDPTVTLVI
jgi:fatty acid synthase